MESKLHEMLAELESHHWWLAARLWICCSLIRSLVLPGQNKLIVDVGCGIGSTLAALAPDYRCLGIDCSPTAIRLAQERHPNVHFAWGDCLVDVPDELREADMIIAMDVLEHIEEDQVALCQLIAAAAEGAAFLLTVPADMMIWSPHDVAHRHYRRYDRRSFEQLWAGLPVETLLISYFNTRLYWPIRLARTISRNRGRAWGKAGTDLWIPPLVVNRMLYQLFVGESKVLLNQLQGRSGRGYGYGASLMAVLRKRCTTSQARTGAAVALPTKAATCTIPR